MNPNPRTFNPTKFTLIPGGRHISQAPDPQPDGLCHCDPCPMPDAIGECPTCRRLNTTWARNTAELASMVGLNEALRQECLDLATRLMGFANHPSTPPALFLDLGRNMVAALQRGSAA